jgi:hypothetical protein
VTKSEALISAYPLNFAAAGKGWQTRAVQLPADDHVHSEWSWDASLGAMDATCARAVEMGVPAIAFTEQADFFHCGPPSCARSSAA